MVRDATQLSLLSRQRHGLDRLSLVHAREKAQHSGADFVHTVCQDICPSMAKIVVQGDEGGLWKSCHRFPNSLGRGPLIARKRQESGAKCSERTGLQTCG